MQHKPSYHKQLRKKITVRAVMKKKFEADIDENNDKIDDTAQKSKESKKTIVRGDRKIENTENFLWELLS